MKILTININLAIDKTARVPALKPGEIYRFSETLTMPGGKGVNVARALKTLGLEPVVAGFASGLNGRWITERLSREGLKSLIVRHTSGESRICYSVVDASGRATDLNEDGPAVPAQAQSVFLRKLSSAAGDFALAAVSGRVSSGLRKGFYSRMTVILKKAGCFVAFDTSGAELREGLNAGADAVKINKSEFEEISGTGFSRKNAALFFRKYSPLGLKALIVTNGPHASVAVSQFGCWDIRSVPLGRIASPVGAGDSFMAGFIYGFMNDLHFASTLKLAAGCAASDCMSLGAGLISRKEALAFAEAVRVREF